MLKLMVDQEFLVIFKDNSVVRGNPAFDASLFNRSYVYFKNLVNLFKDVEKLKKD